MNLEKIRDLLLSTGLPVAYRCFPIKEAPPLPYICYIVLNSDNFSADGTVYTKIDRVQIELYTREKDVEAETKVENVLSLLFWQKVETYIETEKCYQIAYEIEV